MKIGTKYDQHNVLCFPPQGRFVASSRESGMFAMIDDEPSRAKLVVNTRKVLTDIRHTRDSGIILSDSLSDARVNGFTIRIESPVPEDRTRGR